MKGYLSFRLIVFLFFFSSSLFGYRVKKGDTLWGLAKKNHISISHLKKINNISGNSLVPGLILRFSRLSSNGLNRYIVKKGDSIWGICRRFNLTKGTFLRLNNLKSSVLKIGTEVIVKSRKQKIARVTTRKRTTWHWYRIKKRDSFWSIAHKYKITVASLKRFNRKKGNSLYPGSKIKIPGYARKTRSYSRSSKSYFGSIPFVGKGFLKWPMQGRVVARFGVKRTGINNGITIKGYKNKLVRASGRGIVVFSGSKRGYGHMVIIRHKNSIYTVYAGLKSRTVRVHKQVSRGDRIGQCGWFASKKIYGLRFQIYNKTKPVNPLKYLG